MLCTSLWLWLQKSTQAVTPVNGPPGWFPSLHSCALYVNRVWNKLNTLGFYLIRLQSCVKLQILKLICLACWVILCFSTLLYFISNIVLIFLYKYGIVPDLCRRQVPPFCSSQPAGRPRSASSRQAHFPAEILVKKERFWYRKHRLYLRFHGKTNAKNIYNKKSDICTNISWFHEFDTFGIAWSGKLAGVVVHGPAATERERCTTRRIIQTLTGTCSSATQHS